MSKAVKKKPYKKRRNRALRVFLILLALTFTAALFGHAGSAAVGVTPQFLAALAMGTFLSFAPAFVPRLGISDWRLPDAAPDWKVWLRTAATAVLLGAATLPLLTSGFA